MTAELFQGKQEYAASNQVTVVGLCGSVYCFNFMRIELQCSLKAVVSQSCIKESF